MNAAVQQIIMAPPPLCPAVQAWANAVSVKPSKNYLKNLNTFVLALQGNGIWAQLDRLWVFATETKDNALIDLVSLSSATEQGGLGSSWTALSGYTGNGTGSYLNTNYNAGTNAVNYKYNSASIGFYQVAPQNTSGIQMGWADSTYFSLIYANLSGNDGFELNTTNSQGTGAKQRQSSGLYACSTINNNASQEMYYNGTAYISDSNPGAVIAATDCYLFCFNNNGTATDYSNSTIGMAFIGGGGINQPTLYNAWTNFLTSL